MSIVWVICEKQFAVDAIDDFVNVKVSNMQGQSHAFKTPVRGDPVGVSAD